METHGATIGYIGVTQQTACEGFHPFPGCPATLFDHVWPAARMTNAALAQTISTARLLVSPLLLQR